MKITQQALSSLFVLLCFVFWFMLSPSHLPPLTLCAMALHELGHYIAIRRLRTHIDHFSITPGEARLALSSGLLSYRKEALVALAGPAFNLVTAALGRLFGGRLFSGDPLSFFITVSLALALINLLPIGTLDGGRIVRCLLISRFEPRITDTVCRLLSLLSLFCLWCLSVYALMRTGDSLSLFLFSVSLFLRILSDKDVE